MSQVAVGKPLGQADVLYSIWLSPLSIDALRKAHPYDCWLNWRAVMMR